jgi:hypothetical protein
MPALHAQAVLAGAYRSIATFVLVIALACILGMSGADSDVVNVILVLGSATVAQIQYQAWDKATPK